MATYNEQFKAEKKKENWVRFSVENHGSHLKIKYKQLPFKCYFSNMLNTILVAKKSEPKFSLAFFFPQIKECNLLEYIFSYL